MCGFSPGSGIYNTPQQVTISNAVAGATIHYTTDGSPPTISSPIYSGPVSVSVTTTIRAKAWKTGWTESAESAAQLTLKVATPTFSPGGGPYSAAQTVTVNCVTPGAVLHYTTSGAEPSESDPTVAAGGTVTVDRSLTLRVRGYLTGWTTGDTGIATYFITLGTVATPTFSPTPGSFTGSVAVTISTATSGATIRYTVDGTDPTFRSPVYSAPLGLNDTTVVKARAFKLDFTGSATATGTYTLNTSAVQTPTIQPGSGTYPSKQTPVITCGTPGATIHYTTNGQDPTEADPTIASGSSLPVTASLRLKARAWKSGVPTSGVRTADFVLTGAVSAAGNHTLVLKADGTVSAFGQNSSGQLGNGNTTQQNSPVAVSTLTNVIAIAAGETHSLALTSDRKVWGWGRSIANGAATNLNVPTQITALTDIVAIAAGVEHSMALKSDGTLYTWGTGTLGDGTITGRSTPAAVAGLTGITDVAGGSFFTLAAKTDGAPAGALWAFGNNPWSEVGDGTAAQRLSPIQVLAGGVTGVATGRIHSFALLSDGNLMAWAYNATSQLGLGDSTLRTRPTQVGTMTQFALARGGETHSVAQAQESLWGFGAAGKVGDCTSIQRSTPVPLVAGVQSSAAGRSHSVALKWDGTVLTWGTGSSGQLGLGTTTNQVCPTLVPALQVADQTWLTGDPDGDGLSTREELAIGSDPLMVDTNGDGISDGAAAHSNLSATDTDMDDDGVLNAAEVEGGTDPFRADTDEDGVADGADCFPLDPARSQCPPPNPGDTTPPVITLTEPTNALLINSTCSPGPCPP
jgi:alpha-tubulin suppressor-like RCC1 family protein